MNTHEDIDDLAGLTYEWAKQQESNILLNGVELSADQKIDAFLAGVKNPDKIRLLKTDIIPFPDHPSLTEKLEQLGVMNNNTVGLTLGYGIYIKSAHWERRELLVHECVHVMQYEKLGFRDFLHQYISECLSFGYPFGPLETEAREIEQAICRAKT